MADNNIFDTLKKLFSNDVVVRKVGSNRKVKMINTGDPKTFSGLTTNYLEDRYSSVYSSKNSGGGGFGGSGYFGGGQQNNFAFHARRTELYQDYDLMDERDPIINSALDIYAEECTTKNEFGNVIEINTPHEDIAEILENLYYDILNVELNLPNWIRNTCKYGDTFLHLHLAEKYGIVGFDNLPVYSTHRIEGAEENNPNLVQFGVDGGGGRKSEPLEFFEVAHFRLLMDTNFLPYGKSMIESARRTWKQLQLMEDAMLIHRIMRAPERRMFFLDIGSIPPDSVEGYVQDIINKTKRESFIDPQTGEYNLEFNMMNMTEDFYMPVRGSDSGTRVDTLGGLNFDATEDINYVRNKMMAALKIPKAFLGYEDQLSGKSTLAQEDMRFARTIEKIQRNVTRELERIGLVHLFLQGFDDEKLVDFSLKLTNPSTVWEQEKIDLWSRKVSLARDMKELNMLSTDFIYDTIFKMSDDEMKKERSQVLDDVKRAFRYEQIEREGNDPVKTGQSFGTPHDLATMDLDAKDGEGDDEESFTTGSNGKENHSDQRYGDNRSALGYDPIGKKASKDNVDRGREPQPQNTNKGPLSLDHRNLAATLQALRGTKPKPPQVISETMDGLDKESLVDQDEPKLSEIENMDFTFLDEEQLK